MRFRKPKLRFALDEGVPNSVGILLKSAGHSVLFFNTGKYIPRGSKDNEVCAAAILNEAILVATDGDMKQIAKKNGISNSAYSRLSLLKLSCDEPSAASRVEACMSLIEHEWHVGDGQTRRLFVEIQKSAVRTNR